MTVMKVNIWKSIVRYINSSCITQTWIKDDLIRYIKESNESYFSNSCSTITNYINILHKTGYIERVGYGTYKKLSDIEEDITSSFLTRAVYDKEYSRAVRISKLKMIIDGKKT